MNKYSKGMQTAIAVIYCNYIAKGHTIYGLKVRLPTLKGYMKAMAEYTSMFCNRDVTKQPNSTQHEVCWETHPKILAIYKDTKEWQGIPNRQDPLSFLMIEYLQQEAAAKHQDCMEDAIVNWTTLGASTGFRGKEWCQPKNPDDHGFELYDKPSAKFDNRIYALCEEDMKFIKNNRARKILTLREAVKVPASELIAVRIRWRYQKNGNHGEEIEFQKSNDKNKCALRAAYSIASRFVRLKANRKHPLAIYKKNRGSRKYSYLIRKGVEKKLQIAAWKTHYTECETLKESPAKITLHSVRILAAVILFADGATDSILMGRLRYKSDKFRIYYRNVPALSAVHSRAVTTAETHDYDDCALISDDEDD